eukprot:403360112
MFELKDLNNLDISYSKPRHHQIDLLEEYGAQYDDIGQIPQQQNLRNRKSSKHKNDQKEQACINNQNEKQEDLYGFKNQSFNEKPNKKQNVGLSHNHVSQFKMFVFLVILGVLTALICYTQDLLIFEGITCNYGHDESINYWVRYAGWITFNISCVMFVACIGEYFSRDSEGSSLPEMKAILAGVYISNFLSVKALIGKFVGVTIAIVGGLSLGRYGSFVHMSAVIAHQISHRVSYFKDISLNYQTKLQIYSAAIAAGTCCSAGCPIGGIIFALELTATYYMLGNLMKGLICTTACIITFYFIHELPLIKPANFTTFEPYQLNHEIIFFVLLGYISAHLSQLFINILSKVVFLRAKLKNSLLMNRWKWCFIVTLFISVLQWEFMDRAQLRTRACDLLYNKVHFYYSFFNTTFTKWFIFSYDFLWRNEGIYAVVGAACVYGGATKTISIAVIMFELTGQITLIIPVITGLTVSYLISEAITMSIFDVLLEFKNFPFLPSLGSDQTQDLRAKDLINTNFIYLRDTSQMKDIGHILDKIGNKKITIPVLDQQKQINTVYFDQFYSRQQLYKKKPNS